MAVVLPFAAFQLSCRCRRKSAAAPGSVGASEYGLSVYGTSNMMRGFVEPSPVERGQVGLTGALGSISTIRLRSFFFGGGGSDEGGRG